jgi:serine/threonine protein kinase/Tfp pilus assembly protein PilF
VDRIKIRLLRQQMAQPLEGRRIGPYELGVLLGAGGMGEVYRARDTRLNRVVAIKVLPATMSHDRDSRERFEREARAVAALNHPHICVLHDVGNQDGVDFLVMEHLDGETLAARLSKGPLPMQQAVEFATQVASALDRAHRAGIVHRDLKPGNIMLTETGAKLLDFGLAKMVDADVDVTRTLEGTVLGTAAYMSPEQAQGGTLDARSDVFSFGAVLYEMASGHRAFAGQTTIQVLSSVLRDDPPALPASSPLAGIVRRCLAKEPSQRFQAMADVQRALQQAWASPSKEAPSIAVLPFANMSADPENEFFSDGLAEEILNALTKIERLHVAARSSSFSFKGKNAEVGEIAQRLKVRYVLEGSVRKAGSRVRVTAQLVEASNGYQLWSERYDRQLEDIFDVQDEIARSIVERLKVALGAGEAARLVKVATNNMEAYQQYLKGRAMLYRRGRSVVLALESFQKAVELDPEYAQAWAGVADAYTVLCYSGERAPRATMGRAFEAATKATILDGGSAEAHIALANAALLWERDFEKAGREFREALALNPKYTQARCWYGLFFLQWSVGRLKEGLSEAWRATEDDPLSSYAWTVMSFALATVGRTDEAVRDARIALEYDPASFLAKWELGLAYHWHGQYEDAVATLEPLLPEAAFGWIVIGLVPAYAQTGRLADARRTYDELLARRSVAYVSPFSLAVCASTLGDHDDAIRFCETAIEERDMLFALFHNWLPDFERVRADSRFPDILARFNRGRRV